MSQIFGPSLNSLSQLVGSLLPCVDNWVLLLVLLSPRPKVNLSSLQVIPAHSSSEHAHVLSPCAHTLYTVLALFLVQVVTSKHNYVCVFARVRFTTLHDIVSFVGGSHVYPPAVCFRHRVLASIGVA